MASDLVHAMPAPPAGYAACRTCGGSMTLFGDPGPVQTTHLVLVVNRGTPGPTLCGLTRFGNDADLPGWSIGGGVSGPGVEQERCAECWRVAEEGPKDG